MRISPATLAAFALLAVGGGSAQAEPPSHVVALTLKNHRFVPDTITVPAGQRIRIELSNEDAATEEFDSDDLHVEKDVSPHGKVSFFVGPWRRELTASWANCTRTPRLANSKRCLGPRAR